MRVIQRSPAFFHWHYTPSFHIPAFRTLYQVPSGTKRHIASRLYAFPVFVPERLPLSTHRSEESYPAERSCLVGGAGACSILRTSPFQSFVQIRSFCLRVYAPSAQMVLSLPDSSSEVYFVVHKDDSRSAASFVFQRLYTLSASV